MHVTDVSATGGENNMWLVTATVAEPVDQAQAARLGDDTGVIHFDNHGRYRRTPGR